jgi:hypothetical protein
LLETGPGACRSGSCASGGDPRERSQLSEAPVEQLYLFAGGQRDPGGPAEVEQLQKGVDEGAGVEGDSVRQSHLARERHDLQAVQPDEQRAAAPAGAGID